MSHCFVFQYELIQQMVSHNPALRPDASDIKISVSKHLESLPSPEPTPIRSKSYPSNLTRDQNNKNLHRHHRDGDERGRSIYKTHSAM
jgi:hypothetical protein